MIEGRAFFCGIVFGVIIGSAGAHLATNDFWKREAIQHGAAHYDAKTAAFTWNNEVKP